MTLVTVLGLKTPESESSHDLSVSTYGFTILNLL